MLASPGPAAYRVGSGDSSSRSIRYSLVVASASFPRHFPSPDGVLIRRPVTQAALAAGQPTASQKLPCPKTRQRRFAGGVSPVEESLWPNTLSPAIVILPGAPADGDAFHSVRFLLTIPVRSRASTCVFLIAPNRMFTTYRRISQWGRIVEKLCYGIGHLKNNLCDSVQNTIIWAAVQSCPYFGQFKPVQWAPTSCA